MLTFINQHADAFSLIVATVIAGLIGYFTSRLGTQRTVHQLAERVRALETVADKCTAPHLARLEKQLSQLIEDVEQLRFAPQSRIDAADDQVGPST